LNTAAIAYTAVMTTIAASAGVSTPVSKRGRSNASSGPATKGAIKMPPSTVPRMIEPTVIPSIQPFAATSLLCGKYSVRMPYFAGEYAAAPSPTNA
jgi:hypothetical protein